MKIKYFVALIIILSTSKSFSQEKKGHFELGKNNRITNTLFIPDQYLFVITAHALSMKPELTVLCFLPDGTEAWKKVVPTNYNANMGQRTMVVGSPDGNTIYLVQQHQTGYNEKKHFISIFNKHGEERKFIIEGREEFGEHLQKIFCDDNYLYFLATENGDEKSDKKKGNEKLILNRFSKEDMSYKRFVLNLPAIANDEHSSFWSLIGQRGDEKFFASKNIDIEFGKNKFTVATVTSDGKVASTITLETSLSDGKFTRPSDSKTNKAWEWEVVDLDFTMKETNTSISITTESGAFGHIFYSDVNDCFYTYGLFGPKPYKRIGPVYEGFYVQKFNRNGSPDWKIQNLASNQLMEEDIFRVHGVPIDRSLKIESLLDNNLSAEISFRDIDYRYNVSSVGKVTSFPKLQGIGPIQLISDRTLRSASYVSKDNNEKILISTFQQSTSELVLQENQKTFSVDILLFK